MKKNRCCYGVRPLFYQILRKMKLTLMLLFLTVLTSIAADSYSQSVKFTLKVENTRIEDVLGRIEDQSRFRFFYNEEINLEKKISLNASDVTIVNILDEIFRGKEIHYEIIDRQIILTNNSNLKNLSSQQQKSISGKVTDNTGVGLPGVSVVVKGTTTGIITDMDGKYTIAKVPENAILQFSFVGMKTLEIAIGNQPTLNVVLTEETIGIDEVVAIGYGTQKKATITGSVSLVRGEDLKQSPAVNFSNNLAGRLPGLVAVTRSGEPGNDGATLRIRGSNTLNNNEPLVVIDGIPNRGMERLDPADIESVTILKDASAAIYGAQAANGVILITTKRGNIGKPVLTFNLNQGFNQPTRIPEMASSSQYAEMLNELKLYRGRDPQYSPAEIQKFKDGSDPWNYPNTNWFHELYKTYTPQTYGNASISGGTEKMKYFLSLGGKYQDAFYKNSATNYSQFDFRSNVDTRISDDITIALDIAGRQENKNNPTVSVGNIYREAMRGKPDQPAYWPNGMPGPDIEQGRNPVIITTPATGYDKDKVYVFESNLRINVNIPWIKGLSLTGNASVDKTFRNHKRWETPWYLYSWDHATYDANNEPVLVKGKKGIDDPRLSQDMMDRQQVTLNGLLNYEKNITSDQKLKVLFGIERSKGDEMTFSAYRRFFVSDALDQMFAGGDLEKNNGGFASQSARLNYFGRVNYSIKEKYLAEFVWRYDGSFIFPEGKNFGFFPGVSLGYRISEEKFWKENVNFLQNFKIRGSWGQTGNDRIDPYQFLSSYGFDSRFYVFNENVENKLLGELRIPNPEVTWEIANQANIGFEGQALNGHLYFEADYFNNLRTNILWNRNASVPNSTGLTLPRENIGKVANRGFEFLTRYNNEIGKLTYNISVNGGFQKNEIKFWDETPGIPEYQRSTGHSMNTNLYYKAIGIFKDQAAVDAYPHWANARPGDVIFEDVNLDKKIDGLDRVRIDKNLIPTFTAGVSMNFGYQNFDLSILFQGAAGAVTYYPHSDSGEMGNYLKDFADNRWTPSNIDAKYPRVFNREEEYWVKNRSTVFLYNTDYIRLKNIEFGYTVPVNKSTGIQGLRIYISGLNLLTIDHNNIFDPETDASAGQVYPLNRTYNAGVTLTF